MRHAVVAAALLLFAVAAAATNPTTIANDDSCDIALLPAATLLLPYFEVDFSKAAIVAPTTLFTVQNTTAMPQIARVTLWTDWSYPMLTFNIFLTGYGVQGINLWDLFARGAIAASNNAAPPGPTSLGNGQNPHFLPDAAATCSNIPAALDRALLADLQAAFTTGTITAPGCARGTVGGIHGMAVGYATIDVVANCNATSPATPAYFTTELLFDNVLTGDYQHINPNPATGNYAGGSPLVHIRAVPEGGAAGEFAPTALPYTFYDLYTAGAGPARRTYDRRQPLPSTFMPRVIQGGTGAFNTNLVLWREAFAAPGACPAAYALNSYVPAQQIVRFDEHENPTSFRVGSCIGTVNCDDIPRFPSLILRPTPAYPFPPLSTSGDVAGWMYINLNNGGSPAYSATRNYRVGSTDRGARQSQGWVVTTMNAEGRYAVEMDAIAIGNGCSPAPVDTAKGGTVGPAPNPTP